MRAFAACVVMGCAGATGPAGPDPVEPDASTTPPPLPDAPGVDFDEAPTFEPDGPLCDLPAGYVANGGDPVNPPCLIAIGNYRDPVAPKSSLRIVAWNVRFGIDNAAIVGALATRPELANADILLLSEVPRHTRTSNPQGVDFARDFAIASHRSYAYAVEWDRREVDDELGDWGEHGIAVISRYPIGTPRFVRHTAVTDRYESENLYGGRISLGVDVLVGTTVLSVYASHFDTQGIGDLGRAMQAAEARVDAVAANRPAIAVIGGDFNTWTCNPLVSDCTVAPAAEKTIEDFLSGGWTSGGGSWNGITHIGEGFFPQKLDWVFYRGPAGAIPGQADADANGSDHLPVYFDLML